MPSRADLQRRHEEAILFKQEDIAVATNGGPVEVDVDCGFTQHMDFNCKLFDAQGNNAQFVIDGSNLASDPPPFAINVTPSQLVGRLLLVKATVQRLAGPDFAVDVTFRQDGAAIGTITVEGTIDDHRTVSMVGRFV
jgi:hypothetical protein